MDLANLSFAVKAGEVVGLAGAMGSGRTATLSALFGIARGHIGGTIKVDLSVPGDKLKFNNLSSGWGFDRNNYLVGIGISYNLFDLRRKQLKLRTQKAITSYAQKQLDEQRAALALEVNQADVELNTAKQRLLEIPNQLKAANAGYRQKLSLYKSGLTDIIELNAALNILYRAETDYVQAKYAYSSALFQKAVTGNQVSSVLNLLN